MAAQDPAARKAAVTQSIVAGAARRLRRDGLAATGLRSLMADAGLTHGGFYAHFRSRTALIEAAIAAALADTCDSLGQAVARAAPGSGLGAFVDAYLTRLHCEHAERGCAGAALADEAARQPAAVRRAFARGLGAIIALLESQLPAGGTAAERTARARGVFALLMGALQLARIAGDAAATDAQLAAARAAARALAHQPWNQRAPARPTAARPVGPRR